MANDVEKLISDEEFLRYTSGESLWGNDFDLESIVRWYADEEEGYAELIGAERAEYHYEFHALNRIHGYDRIEIGTSLRVLGFGSAYGHELLPIENRIRHATVIDPSAVFTKNTVLTVPHIYVKPEVTGKLPFLDDEFDLITCFGALHHVPNVEFVLSEMCRCLRARGHLLVREPCVSLGDWRRPRQGLTLRERGIPVSFMRRVIREHGLITISENPCWVPPVVALGRSLGIEPFDSAWLTRLDALVANLTVWRARYHPRNKLDKIAPTSVFYCLRKDAA